MLNVKRCHNKQDMLLQGKRIILKLTKLFVVATSCLMLFIQNAAIANTIIWPTQHSYKTLNPAAMYAAEIYILGNIYETLFLYLNGTVVPRLATAWEKSDDGKTWTVALRQGVTFHDGSAFDAYAVKKSFEYTRDLGKGAGYLYAGLINVETPNSHTAIFKFKQAIAFDLVASGQYGSYVIAPAAIDNGHHWMQAGNAIGTGPYKLSKFEPGKLIVIDKFEDYWGGWKPGQIDRVIQQTVSEASTRVQMIRSGEADIASVPMVQLEALSALPQISVLSSAGWRNNMYLFNMQKYPTNNKKFREALTHLWDHDSVVNILYQGYAKRPISPLPATMWGHGEYDTGSYNLEQAQKLLEESGVPKKHWKIRVMYSYSNQEQVDAIELFQAAAAQLGVYIELSPQPSSPTYLAKARTIATAAHIHSMVWYPAYPTPSDWLRALFYTEEKTLFNIAYYSNPAFDAAVDTAMALEGIDLQKAAKAYIAAQDILMRDTPAIFYADANRVYAYTSTLKGMTSENILNPAYETLFIYALSR